MDKLWLYVGGIIVGTAVLFMRAHDGDSAILQQ